MVLKAKILLENLNLC
ncbi:unnamed protein product [Victoria cruziana]